MLPYEVFVDNTIKMYIFQTVKYGKHRFMVPICTYNQFMLNLIIVMIFICFLIRFVLG